MVEPSVIVTLLLLLVVVAVGVVSSSCFRLPVIMPVKLLSMAVVEKSDFCIGVVAVAVAVVVAVVVHTAFDDDVIIMPVVVLFCFTTKIELPVAFTARRREK